MNLFKYELMEIYSKSEMGSLLRGNEFIPDPLSSPSDEIDAFVNKLNDDDSDYYYLGKVKLSQGTEGEDDMFIKLWATDHFYGRFMIQRKITGGKEVKLYPAELDFKYHTNPKPRSLEDIRDRDLLRELLSKTAQKLANFYMDSDSNFTPYSNKAQQGMGCYVAWDGDQMELYFQTFLPHKRNRPLAKIDSILLLIDDPIKP